MKFVVVITTFKDAPPEYQKMTLPDDYPIQCQEIEAESIDEVKAKFPGKSVFSIEQYHSYALGCAQAHEMSGKVIDLKGQLDDLNSHVTKLKGRGLWARLTNKDVS